MPGSCDAEIRPALERSSGRRVGETLGLCYSPEFIALGNVIRDMLEPDMVLIGESDSRAGDVVERLYSGICENDPPFRRMSLVNAELTKIAVNTYVTMKISYANALADMCERLPGADVEAVTDALGLDSRIGGKYLRGAIAYGGPCFPRDNKAFAVLARDLGAEALLAEATDAVNVAQTERLARIVQSRLKNGSVIGILGLSYKPDTDVIDESPGIALARLLGQRLATTSLSTTRLRRKPPSRVLDGAAQGCIDRRSARTVRRGRDRNSLAGVRRPPSRRSPAKGSRSVVIDCWRLSPPRQYDGAIEIVRLGRALEESSRL